MRSLFYAAVSAVLLLSATDVFAQVTIGSDGFPSDGSTADAYAGEIFFVPAGVTRLDQVKLGVTGSGTFSLAVQRNANYGTNIYEKVSPTLSVNATFPAYDMATFAIPGGVAVTPGEQLFILRNVTSGSPNVVYTATDFYPGGEHVSDGVFSPNDAPFIAIFNQPEPVPFPVPTLSEWAIILFGTILAGSAALYIQCRRFAG